MEVSLSACRVRAEYVDKHVRSIWTLPDIISTDSYAWALGLAPGGNVQRATTVTSARGDPIILSVATGVEGATASIGSTLKLPNSIYTKMRPRKRPSAFPLSYCSPRCTSCSGTRGLRFCFPFLVTTREPARKFTVAPSPPSSPPPRAVVSNTVQNMGLSVDALIQRNTLSLPPIPIAASRQRSSLPPSLKASRRVLPPPLQMHEALTKAKQLRQAKQLALESDWHLWLAARTRSKCPRVPMTEERRQALRREFNNLDVDRSGDVSLDELAGPLMAIGIDPEEIQSMMLRRSTRRGMALDFDAFQHLLLTLDRAPVPSGRAKRGPIEGSVAAITNEDRFPFHLHCAAQHLRELIDGKVAEGQRSRARLSKALHEMEGSPGASDVMVFHHITELPMKRGALPEILKLTSITSFKDQLKGLRGFMGVTFTVRTPRGENDAAHLGDEVLVMHSRWHSEAACEAHGGGAALRSVLKSVFANYTTRYAK